MSTLQVGDANTRYQQPGSWVCPGLIRVRERPRIRSRGLLDWDSSCRGGGINPTTSSSRTLIHHAPTYRRVLSHAAELWRCAAAYWRVRASCVASADDSLMMIMLGADLEGCARWHPGRGVRCPCRWTLGLWAKWNPSQSLYRCVVPPGAGQPSILSDSVQPIRGSPWRSHTTSTAAGQPLAPPSTALHAGAVLASGRRRARTTGRPGATSMRLGQSGSAPPRFSRPALAG